MAALGYCIALCTMPTCVMEELTEHTGVPGTTARAYLTVISNIRVLFNALRPGSGTSVSAALPPDVSAALRRLLTDQLRPRGPDPSAHYFTALDPSATALHYFITRA